MGIRDPAILDLPRTSLSAEDRDTYAKVIDDILADHGEEATSSDDILELLRERTSLALTQQRHHIKVIIIERLQMQPIPQTFALSNTDGLGRASGSTRVAAAVFNVPESMEAILLRLPMRDLAAFRRVNKALHRLIETSPPIQRKLFLLPSKDPPEYWSWVRNNGMSEFVTSSGNPPSPPSPSSPHELLSWLREPKVMARLNPLLEPEDLRFLRSPDETCEIGLVNTVRIDHRIFYSKFWPEMYLTSPPCTSVHINFLAAEGRRYSRLQISRFINDPAGVTLASVWHGLHKEGDVKVFGGYGTVPNSSFLDVEHTTLREQIDHHRRRGIRLKLEEASLAITLSRVTVLRSETRYEGASRPALPQRQTR